MSNELLGLVDGVRFGPVPATAFVPGDERPGREAVVGW
jgi:hypothetical protein